MSSLSITVTRSAGADGAFLVFIDTDFEPDGSDDGPGLRVQVNDGDAFVGKALESLEEPRTVGGIKTLRVDIEDVPYMCAMEYEGTDTDGTVWNRCTLHDKSVMDGAYVCEGYEPPPYKEGH